MWPMKNSQARFPTQPLFPTHQFLGTGQAGAKACVLSQKWTGGMWENGGPKGWQCEQQRDPQWQASQEVCDQVTWRISTCY